MSQADDPNFPWQGAIKGSGTGSLTRIPVPNSPNLVLQLSPIRYKGSTSAVFFYEKDNVTGRGKILRLDYGYNKNTGNTDYHWNQKGLKDFFKIEGHTSAGRAGAALYNFAKTYKVVGRTFVFVGIAMDAYSVAVATNPLRRLTQVASAWSLASVGAARAGALGAEIGTMIEPGLGTAAGGLIFAVGGGAVGYFAGEKAGAAVYDWGSAHFHKLRPVSVGQLR